MAAARDQWYRALTVMFLFMLSLGLSSAATQDFWSFRPLERQDPPSVRDGAKPRGRIDAFFAPERPPADRRSLIRRASFDLVGLPPTPEEVDAFVSDRRPDAFERVVDRLLASPAYGERWARHWLDLARYADATANWLKPVDRAWLYRDWVVRAFNEDLPYDVFVKRQLAADLMDDAGPAEVAALGFFGLSPEYWKELRLAPAVIRATVAEEWEERIDTLGRTFLGLSLGCARCHNHKFDPIPTEDYYALAGVFAGMRLIDRPLVPGIDVERVRKARARVAELSKKKSKAKEIEAIRRATPGFDDAWAHAVEDAALFVEPDGPDKTKLIWKPGVARDLPVHLRGDPATPGEVVPRRFLTALSGNRPRRFTRGSGRLDLAEAIVTDGAPLAARVIVNRVWAHHFGRGIVATPSDFGARGDRPTHPRLLEDLAARFVEGGWSIKRLHREILLSSSWMQSGRRRRLDLEAWRDAMLSASGRLDRRMGGPASDLGGPDHRRRTIYGKVARRDLHPMLRLFDFPDPTAHRPARVRTTTPLQQLFVLNGDFVRVQAEALAKRTLGDQARAYRLLFGRVPTEGEEAIAEDYLREGTRVSYVRALLASNEFMFLD